MTILTRDAILAAEDRKIILVDVPEWGGSVYVRSLAGEERDAFENSYMIEQPDGKAKADVDNIRARFCAWVICDAAGKPLFTPEEMTVLGKKNAAALDRLYEVAAPLSRITKEDLNALKNLSGPATGSAS